MLTTSHVPTYNWYGGFILRKPCSNIIESKTWIHSKLFQTKFIMNFGPSILTELFVIHHILDNESVVTPDWGQVEQAWFSVLHRHLGVPGQWLGEWGGAQKTELRPPPPPPHTLKPEQLHFLFLWASTKVLFPWCVPLLKIYICNGLKYRRDWRSINQTGDNCNSLCEK